MGGRRNRMFWFFVLLIIQRRECHLTPFLPFSKSCNTIFFGSLERLHHYARYALEYSLTKVPHAHSHTNMTRSR